MKITHTDIYRFSIPMHPFTIATGTMYFAQNIFIRVFTDEGIYGVGECSAFPMIVGETQNTCFEMAKDFAALWRGKYPLAIPERMSELHAFTAYNSTAKSAFDMALYDIAAKQASQPLYRFLGGEKKNMETDLTVGIQAPEQMAKQALDFKQQGVRIIKVKLGKRPGDDIERIRCIREAIGENLQLRIDANQGWDYEEAITVLSAIEKYKIAFCEQPMRRYNDHLLPALKKVSPIPIMADESVFDHHDAERVVTSDGCSFVNIKLSKSGGILEALEINRVCSQRHIPCMMGGMLESRLALTAFAHFASSQNNIIFYDMDTCMLGHTIDPVTGGVRYNNFFVELPDAPGIGADVDDSFLATLEKVRV
ncbi:MAG: dipeptide epimerase [Chitinophagaceae bacterium]|nr:dipeptide epimerase [Chitinophagaceae bacterium]